MLEQVGSTPGSNPSIFDALLARRRTVSCTRPTERISDPWLEQTADDATAGSLAAVKSSPAQLVKSLKMVTHGGDGLDRLPQITERRARVDRNSAK